MGCNRVFFWKRLVQKRGQQKNRINYYPFGLTFNSYNQSPKNNYLYNQGTKTTFQGEEGKVFGVERQPELGVDFTKYRVYDPALGRFWNVDPAAEIFPQESWTPYHYSFNNPIRWNDPYGNFPPGGIPLNYIPSASVQGKLSAAQESFSKVFGGSISASGKLYGAGGKAQVGPIKLEGSASVVSVSGKVSQNGVEVGAKGLNAEGKASFASASAKASISGVEGKATMNSEGVQVEGDVLNGSAKASVGENGFELSADNSTKVAAGIQVSVVKVEGSVNIGEAIKGTASLIEAGLEYAADVISSGLDEIQEQF